MKHPWQIRVYEKQQVVFSDEGPGPVELGRQNPGEPGPYCTQLETGRRRMVIARLNEDTVSRQHALVEPVDGDKIRVSNLSKKLPVRLGDRVRGGQADAGGAAGDHHARGGAELDCRHQLGSIPLRRPGLRPRLRCMSSASCQEWARGTRPRQDPPHE